MNEDLWSVVSRAAPWLEIDHEAATAILDALAEAGALVRWQPIATAPRDGYSSVIVWNGEQVQGGWFDVITQAWFWDEGESWHGPMDPQPLAWMPWPDPPQETLDTPRPHRLAGNQAP